MYCYNARYYDPTLGRFLSADPLVQDPATPQFLNRYSYVRNNPINRTDPTGHCEATCQAVIFLVVLVGSLFFGGGGEPDPSVPPGPIQPTPHTPLVSLPGVSVAQFGQTAHGVGTFAAASVLDIQAVQGLARILRRADPGALAELALAGTSDFSTGLSDMISFGLTNQIRERLGLNDYVNKSSGLYKAGQVTGFGLDLGIGGAASLNAGGRAVVYSGEGALGIARGARVGKLIEQTLGGRLLNGLEAL